MTDRSRSGGWRAEAEALASRLGLDGPGRDALLETARLAWEAGRIVGAGSRPYSGLTRRPASIDPELPFARLLSSHPTDEPAPITQLPRPGWGAVASLPTMVGGVVSHESDTREGRQDEMPQVLGPEAGTLTRYQDLGPIGRGGMGEVRRVRDRDLMRVLAMKVVRPEVMVSPILAARFIQEAQIIAQLDHPGIVPAYELGRLPDNRLYFTMKEVRGRTLAEVVREVHASSRGGRWSAGPSGWTLWRLVGAFLTVCEAVAYAHARHVVHRDLKPANVMVGGYGEVLVMDWGLAKVLGDDHLPDEAGAAGGVLRPAIAESAESLAGSVTGTPNYMAPEQARGDRPQIGLRTDVYSLGATLYEILLGRPPYEGTTPEAVIEAVLAGPPPAPARLGQGAGRGMTAEGGAHPGAPPVPLDLWEICRRAMAREPADRFADAAELAAEISAWLEGAKERERAVLTVQRAEALLPEIASLRERAARLRLDARRLLEPVKSWAPVEDKRPGWVLEDEAARLEREADLREIEYLQLLNAALVSVPDLAEAHDRLADHYRERFAAAEQRRDAAETARLEAMLRAHDTGVHTSWLAGTGALTLVTDPAGAEVELHRYEERDRRQVAVYERSLGRTPLRQVPLKAGSYLLVLRAPGREVVRYPVRIGREDLWDGAPPGARAALTVPLPRKGSLGPDDVYVPPGWFWSGGDPECVSAPLRRVWVPGFVTRRFPITNREYLLFLNDLVDRGLSGSAERYVPRERAGTAEEFGAQLYGRDTAGRYVLQADAEGDMWDPDWPVVSVDWFSAVAYADWLAERTGRRWRLPRELEYEKAARGVDGRFFPWGDFLDPTWCCMRDSVAGRGVLSVVDSWPVDQSPYGVRGLAGNSRDWCLDALRPEGPEVLGDVAVIDPEAERARPAELRAYRGGAWNSPAHICRSAYRSGFRPYFRYPVLGFRLVRSYDP